MVGKKVVGVVVLCLQNAPGTEPGCNFPYRLIGDDVLWTWDEEDLQVLVALAMYILSRGVLEVSQFMGNSSCSNRTRKGPHRVLGLLSLLEDR